MNTLSFSEGDSSCLSLLQQQVMFIAHEAAEAVMRIYRHGLSNEDVIQKPDHTPLTIADTKAHEIILSRLGSLTPDIPVLSEESSDKDIRERRCWSQLWLVDPVDGTKEFIRGSGEFSVNIALIQNGKPVLAVIDAPAFDKGYTACAGSPSFRYQFSSNGTVTQLDEIHVDEWFEGSDLKLVGSRSHGRDHLPQWLLSSFPQYSVYALGSSLKLCEIAEGNAHCYLRDGPTSEWDTAAGQLILEQAGGSLRAYSPQGLGSHFHYNQRDSLLNQHFIAYTHNLEKKLDQAITSAR